MINPDAAKNHEYFMRACIALALLARQRGESPVGSVVVYKEKIIGEGIESARTHGDITFHAEIEAIRHATVFLQSQDLSDCILYTTHEPCIMCSYVIRHTRISKVVTGILTGETGGYSSHLSLLSDAGFKKWSSPPQMITGILEAACSALHPRQAG
ncbi:MAG: nucleoside deaminase [Chitinophagaceae bacterium]